VSTQQQAIDLINTGVNVFLTGGAGRGKSFVIRQITNKNTLLCGPTGVSALNVSGVTCHRAFNLPIGLPTEEDYHKISSKTKKILSNKNLKRVVIDEVGMVSALYLDMIDYRLKQARGNQKPFGGVQVIVVGDFFQLSPIIGVRERDIYFKKYHTAFAFGAKCWKFEMVDLEKAYRQENDIHVKVLDSFRKSDKWAPRAFKWLEENSLPYDEDSDMLHLTCYKEDAHKINITHYGKLTTPEHTYKGTTNNSKWSNDIPVPQVLKLREGAKVIIRSNDVDGKYVNGHRGTIKNLYATSAIVTLDSGVDVEVVENTWESYTYSATAKGLDKNVEYVYSQLPLQLGYGITIHSSQGMSLDSIAIDTGRGCFAHGLWYVAISRAKDLTKVSLASNVGMRDLIVDPQVKDFYNNSLDTHQPSI